MAFKKLGENMSFTQNDVLTPEIALADDKIAERFIKMAKDLRKVAPKASDFLYGHAVMMHAAEASLIDQKTGERITNREGKPVEGGFEQFVNDKGIESVRWVSADGIKAYKNANGDIFGEDELKKAYKKWIGKPLCKDHKSDSVDGIRGIIVDTYYDPKFKRVHALFALDKKNYGDLARKVETGYANSVSMGTAVGRSVCYECGNVAQTERDFCQHVRSRNCYGEINLDLNPIELSLVVNGADGLAKVKNIIASMNGYVQEKTARLEEMKGTACVNPTELQNLADTISDMQKKIASIMSVYSGMQVKEAADAGEVAALARTIQDMKKDPAANQDRIKNLEDMLDNMIQSKKEVKETEAPVAVEPVRSTTGGGAGYAGQDLESSGPPSWSFNPENRFASKEEGIQGAFNEVGLLRSKLDDLSKIVNQFTDVSTKEENMNSARLKARAKARYAYWQGGGGVNEPTPGKPKYEKEDEDTIRNTQDKQMVGNKEDLEPGSEGLHPGDLEVKKLHQRAEDLEARRNERRAYWLGGGGINEPTPGKVKYPKEDEDTIRNTQDKQMVGKPEDLDAGTDGLAAGDLEIKKKLLRATLSAKFMKAANKDGSLNKNASRWDIYAGDKLILSATASEIFEDLVDEKWDYLSSAEYARDVMKHIREDGFEAVAWALKGDAMTKVAEDVAPAAEAAPALPVPEAPKADGDIKSKVDSFLNDVEVKIEELRKALGGEAEGLVDVDVDAGKDSPMEGVLASREDLLAVEALLDESADELALVSEKLASDSSTKLVSLASQALSDSQAIVAQANLVIEAAKKKKEDKKKKMTKKEEKEMDKKEMKKKEKEEAEEDDKPAKKKKKAEDVLSDALQVRAANRAALLAKAMEEAMAEDEGVCDPAEEKAEVKHFESMEEEVEDLEKHLEELMSMEGHEGGEDHAEDEMCAEDHDHEAAHCGPMMADDEMHVEEDPMSHKEARRKARQELVARAAESLGKDYQLSLDAQETVTEPKYFEAHPKGGTTTELTHTKTPEAKVETIAEQHDAILEVAKAPPRNVRDAAEDKGDKKVTQGAADAAAAKYWKDFYGQAGDKDSSQFGAELSKEFTKKKASDDMGAYKIKLKRAYDIGLQAQEKGIIEGTRQALDQYVDEVMNFDDAAFESTKRVVAMTKNLKKSAGVLPHVGVTTANYAPAPTQGSSEVDLVEQLKNLGWNSRK